MKNAKRIIIGLLIVAIGVLLMLKRLDIIESFDIFFEGWWTLFIIVPAALGLMSDDDKTGNLIFLTIGILLLLAARDIIDFGLIWKLIVPIFLIYIGLTIIFKDTVGNKVKKAIAKVDTNGMANYTSTFSSQKFNLAKEDFKGAEINSIFGGVDLDLREAKIKDDVVIKATCIFGGADIFLPDNVNVKVDSTSLFGGVEDKRKETKDDNKYTVYIQATCIFGGVEIK